MRPKKVSHGYTRKEQRQARWVTRKLLDDGALERKHECEVCGARPAHCHHIDYSDPSRVMWLCPLHHMQTHSQFGKPAPEWTADIRAALRRLDAQRLITRAEALF